MFPTQSSIAAFKKIAEDAEEDESKKLTNCPGNPLATFLPKFIVFTESPNARIRESALSCINCLIDPSSPSFRDNIPAFMAALSRRAEHDHEPGVQREVCRALSSLLEDFANEIAPSLPSIFEYIFGAMQSNDESVSLNACEFWLLIAESKMLLPLAVPLYPR